MSNYEFLKYSEEDGIGYLILNRPDKLNALSVPVLKEMKALLEDLHGSKKLLKGLIFTGCGEKAFIAGADIASMGDMDVPKAEEFAHYGQSVSFLLEDMPFTVIAAVNGFALGGGCEMALSCDFIYCTENAVFGLPEVSLGLIPGFGGTQRMAKIVGRNRAKEIIYTGRMIKAEEALSLGICLKKFSSKEELIEGCKKTISKISVNSPNSIKIAKKVINKGIDSSNVEGLRLEREQFAHIFSSYDQKEGCHAFVEKRKANFEGR